MEIFWDRVTLKDRAKNVLKRSYRVSFLANLLVNTVSGAVASFIMVFACGILITLPIIVMLFLAGNGETWSIILTVILGILTLALFSAVLLFVTSATGIFQIGLSRFYVQESRGKEDISEVFSGFKNFANKIKALLVYNLYIVLWSLLFVIPGMVAAYRYWMVPYILAENPDIPWKRALEISKATTQGEKGDIFILSLSFLGWTLLGVLACGIGVMFVVPYIQATYAELYGALRYKAISQNIATAEELGDIAEVSGQ